MTKHTLSPYAICIAPVFALALVLIALFPVSAHEYWIEPLDFTPAAQQDVQAHLKVGSDFKGQMLSYIPQFSVGYQLTTAQGSIDLEGMAGDRPALIFRPEEQGLNILTYQTTKNRVTFAKMEKFTSYLATQGMSEIAERHRERGLPESDFAESYSRYAKSLILVGDEVSGQDQATGMTIELVALQNPYSLSDGDELSVQLLYLGQPLADNQVSIFIQDQGRIGELQISRVRTDAEGQINLNLQAGQVYLLNSIKMVEINDQEKVVWESFWASLTFEITAN